jgi:hypothetical protein
MNAGQLEQVQDYVTRIPAQHAKNFRTDAILRTLHIQADTEGFIAMLQATDVEEGTERKKWLLDPKSLVKLCEAKEGLGKQFMAHYLLLESRDKNFNLNMDH